MERNLIFDSMNSVVLSLVYGQREEFNGKFSMQVVFRSVCKQFIVREDARLCGLGP